MARLRLAPLVLSALLLAGCGDKGAVSADASARRAAPATPTTATPAPSTVPDRDDPAPTEEWRRVTVGPYSVELPGSPMEIPGMLPGVEDADAATAIVPGGAVLAMWMEVPPGEDPDVLLESFLEGMTGVVDLAGDAEVRSTDVTVLGDPARDIVIDVPRMDTLALIQVVLPTGGLLVLQTAGLSGERGGLAEIHTRVTDSLRPA